MIRDPVLQGCKRHSLSLLAALPGCQRPSTPDFLPRNNDGGCNGAWVLRDQAGSKQLVYINGPFQLMGPIVRKIKHVQVNCILIGPERPRHWIALLQIVRVRKEIELPHRHDLIIVGPHVTRKPAKP